MPSFAGGRCVLFSMIMMMMTMMTIFFFWHSDIVGLRTSQENLSHCHAEKGLGLWVGARVFMRMSTDGSSSLSSPMTTM